MTSWGDVVVVNCYCHTSPIGWPQMAGLWGSRWQRWPQLCAMLLAGNIEVNRGPFTISMLYLLLFLLPPSLLFWSIRVFYWPTPPEPPPSLWSLAIFAYLMAIMQTAGLGLPPSRSLCKLNIQNTQPQSLGHTATHFPVIFIPHI